jgi:CheY-like chemotaxis protein
MDTLEHPILIVEDFDHVRELLEATLIHRGYIVVSARDGMEALEHIKKQEPSLILADIMMPKMDGFALAQKVRSNPKTEHIPILFISATFITQEDIEFALSLGAVSFLEKPIDAQELVLTVGEILTGVHIEIPEPLTEECFHKGYRKRLEAKLKQKYDQITRAQRLVESVPEKQRHEFEALLRQTKAQYRQIARELEALQKHGGSWKESRS